MADLMKIAEEVLQEETSKRNPISIKLLDYKSVLIDIANNYKIKNGSLITIATLSKIASKGLKQDGVVTEEYTIKDAKFTNNKDEKIKTKMKKYAVTTAQIRSLFKNNKDLIPEVKKK